MSGSRLGLYVLRDRKPVREPNEKAWAQWFGNADRSVAQTVIGDATVSTVFLGLDHGRGDRPLLFETMIFGGMHDQYQSRCATWDEAEEMHKGACDMARRGLT